MSSTKCQKGEKMFINKSSDGKNNICGEKISQCRTRLKISQRALADRMQLEGYSMDKNAIQRIESGKRFITDIELIGFARALNISLNELFDL